MDFAIVYFDRYHQEDPLFLRGLSWALKSEHAQTPPFMLVHGAGEHVERQLEAEGYLPERKEGVLTVESSHEQSLVERSIRETNQKTVSVLTDQLIATVGIQGTDRNLLSVDASGRVRVGKLSWIIGLAQKRVVPVLSAIATDAQTGQVVEVAPAKVLVALHEAMKASASTAVVFFSKTDHAQVKREQGEVGAITEAQLREHPSNPEPQTIQGVVEGGASVLLSNAVGLTRRKHTHVR